MQPCRKKLNLRNAQLSANGAMVNASNKVRLGDTRVSVIEGQVAFTFPSDKTQKENFQPVDGEEVLGKIRGFELSSWNFIGHDPKKFRHYGPMAQNFFAAFGHDGVGRCWRRELKRPWIRLIRSFKLDTDGSTHNLKWK
jgi:hypothetical protein